jgi:hypothetical protein
MRKTILIFVSECIGEPEELIANVVVAEAALTETGVLKQSAFAELLEKIGTHCAKSVGPEVQYKLLYLSNGLPVQWQLWQTAFPHSEWSDLTLDSNTTMNLVESGLSASFDLPELRAE